MVVRVGADGAVEHDGEQVEIGGNERYVSLCRRHYFEASGRPEPSGLTMATALQVARRGFSCFSAACRGAAATTRRRLKRKHLRGRRSRRRLRGREAEDAEGSTPCAPASSAASAARRASSTACSARENEYSEYEDESNGRAERHARLGRAGRASRWTSRFRASVNLPQINERFNATIGRASRDEYVADEIDARSTPRSSQFHGRRARRVVRGRRLPRAPQPRQPLRSRRRRQARVAAQSRTRTRATATISTRRRASC